MANMAESMSGILENTPPRPREVLELDGGVAQVGNQLVKEVRMQISVTFKKPFKEPPAVVANALEVGKHDFADCFCVTIANVTGEGFDARIRRVDADQTWAQPLALSWIAFGQRL